MKKISKQKKIKCTCLIILGVSAISLAFSIPIVLNNNQVRKLNVNYENTFEGNKNKINDFFNDSKNLGYSTLNGSLTTDLSYKERSFWTIEKAIEDNKFNFELPTAFKYKLHENELQANLAYIKPNANGSTYPIVGVRIFKGSGENYYESIYQYTESGLNGFKQSKKELNLVKIIDKVEENNRDYFKLKKEVGSVGQLGLYAKNIKKDDFDENNAKLIELKKNNYFINITDIEVDKVFPSNLTITYDISYIDNSEFYKKTYIKTTIRGFDIELGIDDAKSRVKNFIKENKNGYLSELYQYFSYEKQKDQTEKETVQDAYLKNKIKFLPTDSVLSKLNSSGIVIEFNLYDSKDLNNLHVIPSQFDSKTPSYKLDLISYKNSPNEYRESIFIEGKEQEGEFIETENEKNMNELDQYLNDNSINIDRYLKIESLNLTNDVFLTKTAGTALNTSDIPFEIFQESYYRFKENDEKYKLPFQFKIGLNEEGNKLESNIKLRLNKVIESINKIEDLKLKMIDIVSENNKNYLELNVSLGEKNKDLFISLNNTAKIIIDKNVNFKDESDYYKNQINSVLEFIKKTPKNVWFNLVEENGKITKELVMKYISEGKFEKVFSSITLLNSPTVDLPDYDNPVQLNIDFNYLKGLSKNDINKMVENIKNNTSIEVQLIIFKNTQSQFYKIQYQFEW